MLTTQMDGCPTVLPPAGYGVGYICRAVGWPGGIRVLDVPRGGALPPQRQRRSRVLHHDLRVEGHPRLPGRRRGVWGLRGGDGGHCGGGWGGAVLPGPRCQAAMRTMRDEHVSATQTPTNQSTGPKKIKFLDRGEFLFLEIKIRRMWKYPIALRYLAGLQIGDFGPCRLNWFGFSVVGVNVKFGVSPPPPGPFRPKGFINPHWPCLSAESMALAAAGKSKFFSTVHCFDRFCNVPA